MLAEYISANTVLQKEITQLKKANNPEQEIASLKVKEEQVANKEEPTSGNGLKQFCTYRIPFSISTNLEI